VTWHKKKGERALNVQRVFPSGTKKKNPRRRKKKGGCPRKGVVLAKKKEIFRVGTKTKSAPRLRKREQPSERGEGRKGRLLNQ